MLEATRKMENQHINTQSISTSECLILLLISLTNEFSIIRKATTMMGNTLDICRMQRVGKICAIIQLEFTRKHLMTGSGKETG